MVEIDYERWLKGKIDQLKMRALIGPNAKGILIPAKIVQKYMTVNPNERNRKGETLVYATIKYVVNTDVQIRYLHILFRACADPNIAESRHGKTPLMLACQRKGVEVAALIMRQKGVDLSAVDAKGNTALMYAVLGGGAATVEAVTAALTRSWSFDAFRARNCMGNTAEMLATKNGKPECARLLDRERLLMLQRMHKQLALIHLSAKVKGWSSYMTAYKAARIWLSRSARVRAGRSRSWPLRRPAAGVDARLSRSAGGLKQLRLTLVRPSRDAHRRHSAATVVAMADGGLVDSDSENA